MGRACDLFQTHPRMAAFVLVFAFAFFSPFHASAQAPAIPQPCGGEVDNLPSCAPGIPLADEFHATPLIDGNVSLTWPPGPTGNLETVTLYGAYGNDEQQPGAAFTHYQQGLTQANLVKKLDMSGNPSTNGSIVFLFIGFSNCDIEICGGKSDIWQGQGHPLAGQPCATTCNNPKKNPQAGL